MSLAQFPRVENLARRLRTMREVYSHCYRKLDEASCETLGLLF